MPTARPPTPFTALLGHLSACSLEHQLNQGLAAIASQVLATGERGAMVIKLKFNLIGDTHYLTLTHSLRTVIPQMQGQLIEETRSQTPLQIGRDGQLDIHRESCFND